MIAGLTAFLYRSIIKPLAFKRDPETVHHHFVRLGRFLGRHALTRAFARIWSYQSPVLVQKIHGITWTNPVGLAAGFDKNGELTQVLPEIGFGALEVGSVTGEPCAGNAKPRLWRMPLSQGLIVNYGLNNQGAEKVAARVQKENTAKKIPIGISIAKTNSPQTVPEAAGIADYQKAFLAAEPVADFITINISCPNAYGGEPFTDPEKLDRLLTQLEKSPTQKPIFLKLPAEIPLPQLDALAQVAKRHRVQGLIVANLVKNRQNPKIVPEESAQSAQGSVSGKPVEVLANERIAYLYKNHPQFTIIGCGGIFSAEDAYQKIKLGASLVQLVTGLIYQGPQLIGQINKGLVRLLKQDGCTHISQAIGSAYKKE